jgi:hypothetical protein
LQDELLKIWGERRSTVILITNDVDEAILLADRIYPMTPGPDCGARPRDRGGTVTAAPAAAHEPRAGLSEGASRRSSSFFAPRGRAGDMSAFVEIAQLGKTYETPSDPR